MNSYKLLEESLTNVGEITIDVNHKNNEDNSSYEQNSYYIYCTSEDDVLSVCDNESSHCQKATFLKVRSKINIITTTRINTIEPKKQLTYMVYHCQVIPNYNISVKSRHRHDSERNKTTSFSKPSSIARPLYKRLVRGGFPRWIDESDMPVKDFDIIASKLSVISSNTYVNIKPTQWGILNNYKGLNTKAVKVIKDTRKKVLDTIPWLQTRTCVIYDAPNIAPVPRRPPAKNVASNRPPTVTLASAQAERRWFKTEYEKHIGEPPNAGAREKSRESMIHDAAQSLRSLGRYQPVWERLCYKPVVNRKAFQPIDWDRAPLAVRCVCPKERCVCKGNTLLPKRRIPFVFRQDYLGIRACLCYVRLIKPKPASVLPQKLLKAVNEESNFYKSQEGREILEEKGPEFCMNGCVHFFASNKKMTKDLVEELKRKKKEMPPPPPPPKPLKPKPEKKVKVKRAPVNPYERKIGTQSLTDKEGEFIIGRYSHIVYPSFNEAFVTDATGTMLRMASYHYIPPPPLLDQIGFVKMKQSVKQSISNTGKKIKYRAFGLGGDKIADKGTQYDCNDMADFEEVWGSYQDALQKFNEKMWLIKGSSYKCCKHDTRQLSHDIIPEINEPTEQKPDFIRLPEYVVNEPPPSRLHSFINSLIKRICEKKSVDKNMMGDLHDNTLYRPLTIGSNSNSSSSITCRPMNLDAQGDQAIKLLDLPTDKPGLSKPCCDKAIDDKDATEVSAEKINETLEDTTKAVKKDIASSDNKELTNTVSALKIVNKPVSTLSPTKVNTQAQKDKVVLSAVTSTDSEMWMATPIDGNKPSKNASKVESSNKTESPDKPFTLMKTSTQEVSKPVEVVGPQLTSSTVNSANASILVVRSGYKPSIQKIKDVQEGKEEIYKAPATETMSKLISVAKIDTQENKQDVIEHNQSTSNIIENITDESTSVQTASLTRKTSNGNFVIEENKSKVDEHVDKVSNKGSKSSCIKDEKNASSKNGSKEIVVQHSKCSIVNSEEKFKANPVSNHSIMKKLSKASKQTLESSRTLHINESKASLRPEAVKVDVKENKSSASSKSEKSPNTSFHMKTLPSIHDPINDLIEKIGKVSKSSDVIKNKDSKGSEHIKNEHTKGIENLENKINKVLEIIENKQTTGSEIIVNKCSKGPEIIENAQSNRLIINESNRNEGLEITEDDNSKTLAATQSKQSKSSKNIETEANISTAVIKIKQSEGISEDEPKKKSILIVDKRSKDSGMIQNKLSKIFAIIKNKRSSENKQSEGLLIDELTKDSHIIENKRSKGSTEDLHAEGQALVEKNLSAVYISMDEALSSTPVKKPSGKLKDKISSLICNSKQKIKSKFSKDSKASKISKVSKGTNKTSSNNVIESGCDAFNNNSSKEAVTSCSPTGKSKCSEKNKSIDSIRKYTDFTGKTGLIH